MIIQNSKIPECKILISYTTLTSAYELFLVNSEASLNKMYILLIEFYYRLKKIEELSNIVKAKIITFAIQVLKIY